MDVNQDQALLKIKGVSKIFSRGTLDEVAALDNVSLDVNRGDFITVIGSNGAGKTTLLNLVAGIFPPERGGTVSIGDRDVTGLSEHRRAKYVGRVYQDPQIGTAAKMTISENMSLALLRGQRRGLRIATTRQRREFYRKPCCRWAWALKTGSTRWWARSPADSDRRWPW
jgi:putative ABC transport system ATP-binding protein